jgi:hypothetical protein
MVLLQRRSQRTQRTRVGADRAASALAGPGDTVLAIWNRPEDELLLAGALVAAAERGGAHVVRAVATGAASAAHSVTLVSDHESGAAHVPRARGLRAVQRVIEVYGPDVVLTFDADGVTGDPDRRAVARWVARALKVADPGGGIAHVVVDVAARWPEELVQRMHLADAFWPGFPVRRTSGVGCDVLLDDDEVGTKMMALDQAQPGASLRARLTASDFGRLAAIEGYRAVNDAASAALSRLGEMAGVAA